jgi:hypothetical protein
MLVNLKKILDSELDDDSDCAFLDAVVNDDSDENDFIKDFFRRRRKITGDKGTFHLQYCT